MEKVCNNELYLEVSKELELNEGLIKDIIQAQSQFTKMIMERGAFEGVRYVYLGKICAKLKKVQMMNHVMGQR